MIKMSSYWKCQLIGWSAFVGISYVFNNIIYQDYIGFFYKAIIIFFLGLLFSHLIKLTIKITGILQKKFVSQLISLSVLTIGFSMVGTYVWMITLIKLGVWNIGELKKTQPDISFHQVYFYNLFIILLTLSGWVLIYFLVHYVRNIRKSEQEKVAYKYQMIELEANALRAQMNPHFIFNCLNSIKSLIQKNEQEKAISYLTTFSKLIRTVFQNSDKREITLYDEIETCRLYMQLESMRFGNKFRYRFDVDEGIDLKSVNVPSLIIQPFIENAIWHGIMPKEEQGSIGVRVNKSNDAVCCIIDDNGIGRKTSKQNMFSSRDSSHQSKGEHLTQARLEIDNLINGRKTEVRIIDKQDENAKSLGTTVILTFKDY